jgi:hypothetical protein
MCLIIEHVPKDVKRKLELVQFRKLFLFCSGNYFLLIRDSGVFRFCLFFFHHRHEAHRDYVLLCNGPVRVFYDDV